MSGPAEDEFVWLTGRQIKILHAEAVALFGGSHGIRDEDLLESAIGRARNLHAYEPDATIFELAAAYGFGIAKNHPFVDGNKRAALLAIRAFQYRNGYAFDPDEVETVTMMEGIASGKVSARELAAWIERSTRAR